MTSAQTDMKRRSALAEGEDRLTALPTELLASIVEQLPVREMCRLRSLSRHFRNFIDTNQGLLTQNLVSHHRARINREYKLLTDLSDSDIVDALRRYDSHYDVVIDDQVIVSGLTKIETVSSTLYFNWIRSHHFPAAASNHTSSAWVQIYSIMIFPELAPRHTVHLSVAVGVCFRNHVWSPGFTNAAACKAKLKQVTSTRVDAAYADVKFQFITQRKAGTTQNGTFTIHEGIIDPQKRSKLEQLLGLPDLESTEGSLAYCVSSGKRTSLVLKMDQGPSTKLKQAAIIEELFIW
ncbi:hypothetical protein MBLNU13_g03572t2 [Cladosporium sp. NU13]